MIRAAGILFVTRDDRALFLKRGPAAPDFPGCWDFPGGGAEGDETAEETASREAREEIGGFPAGKLAEHTRSRGSFPLAAAVAGAAPAPPASPAPAAPPIVPPDAPEPLPIVPPDAPEPLSEPVDYTTFLQRVDRPFAVTLDDEHVGYAWAPVGSPPEPLHPGCRVALDRLTMDELGVARAIADGHLTSPQRYENMSLFDIRITGVDTAYRKQLDEFVYRRPENYLTPEFVARCNGLAVIMEHPAGAVLNSREFEDRIVGMVFVPYIKGDEVWGVAKIYDDEAVKILGRDKMSTSPSVVFRNPEVNDKLKLEDGSNLLIEGKPSLLDHIAICERGVWDKGGDPTGVNAELETVARGDSAMPEEIKKDAEKEVEKKEDAVASDAAKADAEAGKKLDQCLTHLDSMSKRMDALEAGEKKDDDDDEDEDEDEKPAFMKDKRRDKARKDAKKDDEDEPEEVVADRKKDDEDEPEVRRDKKRKDEHTDKIAADARKDSQDIRDRIARVESLIKPRTDEDRNALADTQHRADSVLSMFGERATSPMDGETPLDYRRRMIKRLQDKSPTWKGADITAFADSALDIVERQVYADAGAAALNPADLAVDQLRAIRSTDDTGRVHTRFAGQPRAWMSQFSPPTRRVVTIETRSNPNH